MSISNNIYTKLPFPLQNVAITAFGYYWRNRRFGGEFQRECVSFRERNTYDHEQWRDYQTTQLRRLLVHAYSNVPFYTERFSKIGLSRRDLVNFQLEDLPKLPFLDKEDLRKWGESKLLSRVKEKGTFYSSSGSTGTPTRIYISPRTHRRWSAAFEVRIREWAGVDFRTPRGMIGGRRVVSEGNAKPPYYRLNHAEKQTYFSAYHISPTTIGNYIEGMQKSKIEYMTGYAMSNYFLAKAIQKAGLKAPKLKAVITSSELLTDQMRQTFLEVYGCNTFDSYSGVEGCGLISETPEGIKVSSPDVGILEVLSNYSQRSGVEIQGEGVFTGLLNFDQPLIRYRIGDRFSISEDLKNAIGIHMPEILKIEGRVEDHIVGPDERVMVRFHGIVVDIEGIKAAQVVQKSLDRFILRLVIDSSYIPIQEEKKMRSRMISQLGDAIVVDFEYVENLYLTNAGKVKAVIKEF